MTYVDGEEEGPIGSKSANPMRSGYRLSEWSAPSTDVFAPFDAYIAKVNKVRIGLPYMA